MNPALPTAWHYVYVLRCSKAPWIYIGCTNCVEKRLAQHNDGEVYSTKSRLPIELMYYEAYKTKELAYKREKKLKSYGSSLAKLKSRIGIAKERRAGMNPALPRAK